MILYQKLILTFDVGFVVTSKSSGNQWLDDHCREISRLLLNLDDLGVKLDKDFLDEDSASYVLEDLKSNIDLLHEIVPALDDVASDLANSGVSDVEDLRIIEKEASTLSGPAAYNRRSIMDRFPSLYAQHADRLANASWSRHNRIRRSPGKAKPGDIVNAAGYGTSHLEEISLSVLPQTSQSDTDAPGTARSSNDFNSSGDTQHALVPFEVVQSSASKTCDSCRRLNMAVSNFL